MGFHRQHQQLLIASAAVCALAPGSAAMAQVRSFDIAAGPARTAVPSFSRQAGIQILSLESDLAGRNTNGVRGDLEVRAALARLISGAGLTISSDDGRTFILAPVRRPAAPDGARRVQVSMVAQAPPEAPVRRAPPASASPTMVDEVVITGSRIARSDYVSVSPIVTSGQEAIQQTGAPTIEATLNKLPQFTPSVGAASTFPNKGGQANLSLRGLGANRSLVLIDGRRAQPSNGDSTVDVNTIPNILIDRVETITGGASATYGSDAMAGVVNFRLKSNFEGLQLNGQATRTGRNDGETYSLSVLGGRHLQDGRLRIMGALDFANRQEVQRRDRAFSRISLTPQYLPTGIANLSSARPSQAAVNSVFAKYGFPAPGPITSFGINPDGTLFKEAPNTTPVINYRGTLDSHILNLDNSIVENGAEFYDIQIPLTRYSGFARVNYDFSDHLSGFVQGLYTQYHAVTNLTGTTLGGTGQVTFVPVTNPFIPADLRTLLNSRAQPGAPFSIAYLMDQNGPKQYDTRWKVYQFLGGLKGDLPVADWTWDASLSLGRTDNTDQTHRGAQLSLVRAFLSAPGGGLAASDPVRCQGGFNIFGNVLSQDCVNQVQRSTTSHTRLEQQAFEANVQGGLFDLPAGRLKFSAGAGYRRNTYDFQPDPILQAGDLAGSLTIKPGAGSQTVSEVYGELLAPLVRDAPLIRELNLDLGYRYSSYNRIGEVSTYKADFDWSPVAGLRLRGGYAHAVRAPSLSELYAGTNAISFAIGFPSATSSSGDPCDIRSSYRGGSNAAAVRALCVAQGVPAGAVDSYVFSSTTGFGANQGNPKLTPERADTYSIGAVWRSPFSHPLLSRMQGSVDYFQIGIDDAIGQLSLVTSIQLCFNSATNPGLSATNFYCQFLRRDANGNLNNAQSPTLNLASYKTSGIDMEFDWVVGLGAVGLNDRYGSLGVNVVATYVDRFTIKVLPTSPALDYAGSTSGVTSNVTPKWRSLATFTYSVGPADLNLRWRRIGSVIDASRVTTPASTVRGVKAYDYYDLNMRWKLTDAVALRGGVNNLQDRGPPLVGTSRGTTDYSTYDSLGRTFYLAFQARF